MIIFFCCCRFFDWLQYFCNLVTLWYRAPEILLGIERYSTKIDVWSLGLIIAEMARTVPLFDGQTELEMILDIFQFHGTPQNEENSLYTLPHFNAKFPKFKGCVFEKQMGCMQHEKLACDLLKVLCLRFRLFCMHCVCVYVGRKCYVWIQRSE